jgi:hypothetical protein
MFVWGGILRYSTTDSGTSLEFPRTPTRVISNLGDVLIYTSKPAEIRSITTTLTIGTTVFLTCIIFFHYCYQNPYSTGANNS